MEETNLTDRDHSSVTAANTFIATPKEFFEIPVKNSQLTIPVDLLEHAIKNNLVKALSIYIYFKCASDGIVNECSETFQKMSAYLGVKSPKTIQRHLRRLRHLNWIGYDGTAHKFYIRGIPYVFRISGLQSGQAIVFDFSWIGNFKEFVDAALVARQINKIKYRMWKEKSEPATKIRQNQFCKSLVAKQGSLFSLLEGLDYTGVSLRTMASLFNCSKSNAVKRKKAAISANFLSFTKKWKHLRLLDKPDYYLRKNVYDNYPQLIGRIRFRWVSIMQKKTRKLVRKIDVSIQRVDQAFHHFVFKHIKLLNND
jgi:hypothetical protein